VSITEGSGEERPSVLHGSFTLERVLPAPPGRVFAAFADAQLRARWSRLPGPAATAGHELDFRVGGGAVARNTFVAGDVAQRLENHAHFLDIVPGERLVFAYRAVVDDVCRWASLVTVELRPDADADADASADASVSAEPGSDRTVLTWTERYAFLVPTGDGADDAAHLRGGTLLRLNGLESVLGVPVASGSSKLDR
jgi:uncharacterized protein YndB with AHSA1/START domain